MTKDISTLEFVAFDTETTGLRPHSEALVEVAAVRFSLLGGPKEYFQTLINPERPIPAQATAVHGITDEMVSSAPALKKVLPLFFQFLNGAVPVAHNAPFDLGFLSLHGLRCGQAMPEVPVLDSCMFSRRICKEQPSHRLQSLVEAFGIAEGTFHRALADAKSCMEVFRIVVGKSCGPSASWEALVKAHGRLHSFQSSTRPLADPQEPNARLGAVYAAMQEKRSVWIQYEGSYGPREVTPLLLYANGSQQYMEATCHLDGIRKSFRLDRIQRSFAPQVEEGMIR